MTETTTIRVDKDVKNETSRIAKKMGMNFNMVVNILLAKFNADKGFSFPLNLQEEEKDVFDLDSEEFMILCREAVKNRSDVPQPAEYVTTIDSETGQIVKKYKDGRLEYVI